MLGSIFNKALESAGKTMTFSGDIIDQYSEEAKRRFNADLPLYKTFRGMSTKDVQKDWGRTELKTSEGIVKTQEVEYTIDGWVDNFESYLKSAMSYTGKKELPQFIGGVSYNFITQNSFNRFNK
jgi:phosphotransacetylase